MTYLCYSSITEYKFHLKKVDHEEKGHLGVGMLLSSSACVCVCVFFFEFVTSADILQILGLVGVKIHTLILQPSGLLSMPGESASNRVLTFSHYTWGDTSTSPKI